MQVYMQNMPKSIYGNGIELEAVGLQFEPRLSVAPLWCDCSSRTVVVIKLWRTSALLHILHLYALTTLLMII